MKKALQQVKKTSSFFLGASIFSMFFGAGNIVFPLILGKDACGNFINTALATAGLLLTGVMVPLIGLCSMTLFSGDYRSFFSRIGKIPGLILIYLILGVIGPFGGIPRCITISHVTLQQVCPIMQSMPIWVFALISCFLIFFFTFKKSSALDKLGKILTPILVLCLLTLIVSGVCKQLDVKHGLCSIKDPLFSGIALGYQTMDLLSAFFFSSAIIFLLRTEKKTTPATDKEILKKALSGSKIACCILSVLYMFLVFLASKYSGVIQVTKQEQIFGALSSHIMGSFGGVFTGISVALACLTTEIAIAIVFCEFLKSIMPKVKYVYCIIVTLAASYMSSLFGFDKITHILIPILSICYPALIVLSTLNISYKLYNFKWIKTPFYAVLSWSTIYYFYNLFMKVQY